MEALSPHPSRSQALLISVPVTAVTRQKESPLRALFFRASQSQMKLGWAWKRQHFRKKRGDFTSSLSKAQPAASWTQQCCQPSSRDAPDALSARRDTGGGTGVARDGAAPPQPVTPSKDGDGKQLLSAAAAETTQVGFHPPWAATAPHGRKPLMIARCQVRKALIALELLLAHAIVRQDCCSRARRPGVLLTFCFACCSLWQLQQRDGSWQAAATEVFTRGTNE